jgi:hypothetical protein
MRRSIRGIEMRRCLAALVALTSAVPLVGAAPVIDRAPAALAGRERSNGEDVDDGAGPGGLYVWQNGGFRPPIYGLLARGIVCSNGLAAVTMMLTQADSDPGQRADVYVWAPAEGAPGAVAALRRDCDAGAVAAWPRWSEHVVSVRCAGRCDDGWFVGYRASWTRGGDERASDADSAGDLPATKVREDRDEQIAWRDVPVVWGARAIGEMADAGPSPSLRPAARSRIP